MPLKRRKKRKSNRGGTILKKDGIIFKSKLELYCYTRLKEENLQFEYEKYSFILQPQFEFNNESYELIKKRNNKEFKQQSQNVRAITYKPDFVSTQDNWVIECKGYPNDNFLLKWKMFKHFIWRNGLKIKLYVPRNQKQIDEVINLIKNEQQRKTKRNNK
ncbi:MAG: DUF1064 domain-containing protein [bacterium]